MFESSPDCKCSLRPLRPPSLEILGLNGVCICNSTCPSDPTVSERKGVEAGVSSGGPTRVYSVSFLTRGMMCLVTEKWFFEVLRSPC